MLNADLDSSKVTFRAFLEPAAKSVHRSSLLPKDDQRALLDVLVGYERAS